ncbi:hypothetical protein MP638_006635 [Amoeboaphelidium occidentale]|nr:hypothetical protein MP638_006635 [Amoeboaphelidium occidentale]
MNETVATSQIELRLSCSDLPNLDWFSKTDCRIFVYLVKTYKELTRSISKEDLRSIQQNSVLLGKTEEIRDNLNPVFSTPILVDYHFEQEQLLRFILVDIDNASETLSDHDYIGAASTSLADILVAPGQKITLPIKNKTTQWKENPTLTISAEETVKTNHELEFTAKLKVPKKGLFGMSRPDPFLKAFREREDGSVVAVWTSEVCYNTTEPIYKVLTKLQSICNSDTNRSLIFKVFDWEPSGDHIYIGEFSVSVDEIIKSQGAEQNIWKYEYKSSPEKFMHPQNSKKDKVGSVQFVQARVIEKFSFVDYLKAGTQLNFSISIDFTQSNGDPALPHSLHFTGSGANYLNDYEHAIVGVGNIIQKYDTDKIFPTYGFGAKLPSGQVTHCWPLNGMPESPGCLGIQEVLTSYRLALQNVKLHGPTLFAPFISSQCDQVEAYMRNRKNLKEPWTYQVLLIITDGEINDMPQAIKSIVRASHLPISIIIIGVGNGSTFEKMDILDGDDAVLTDQDGVQVLRDIVQFVPMRQLKNSKNDPLAYERELASLVLAELPGQVVDWFSKKRIAPGE